MAGTEAEQLATQCLQRCSPSQPLPSERSTRCNELVKPAYIPARCGDALCNAVLAECARRVQRAPTLNRGVDQLFTGNARRRTLVGL